MVEPSVSLLDQLEIGRHISNFIFNTDKKGKAAQTFEWLSNRLQVLEGYWQTINKNHGLVCRENQALRETHEYFTDDQYYEIEDAYVAAKSELATRMYAVASPADASSNSAGGTTVQLLPQAPALPAIQMPKFSGEQRDWESFKELFCSMIKDQPNIPKVQKLHRLLTCLEGKAAARLKGIAPTGSNFDAAWNILMTTYDNQRVKLSDHLKRLLTMPQAKQCTGDIIKLLDTVEESIRSLSALKRPVNQWDDWFIQLVEMRLDAATRVDWEKSIEGQEDFPRYSELKSFLEHRCRTLMTAGSVEGDSTKIVTKPSSRETGTGSNKKFNSRSLSTHTVQVQQSAIGVADDRALKTKLPCSLCQGKHFISYCPRFINSDSVKSWSLAKQAGLCFNCLRPSHGSGGCPSTQRCKIDNCNGLHHTFLHTERVPNLQSPHPNQSGPTYSMLRRTTHR